MRLISVLFSLYIFGMSICGCQNPVSSPTITLNPPTIAHSPIPSLTLTPTFTATNTKEPTRTIKFSPTPVPSSTQFFSVVLGKWKGKGKDLTVEFSLFSRNDRLIMGLEEFYWTVNCGDDKIHWKFDIAMSPQEIEYGKDSFLFFDYPWQFRGVILSRNSIEGNFSVNGMVNGLCLDGVEWNASPVGD